jgi:c-di-GMP-binding flagellar brake protein YcgR
VLDVRSAAQEVLMVQHSSQLHRRQLRNFVRLDVKHPLKFRVIRSEIPDFSTEQCDAQMMDLSGGGLSFKYEKLLHVGDTLSINFDLTTGPFRGVVGKIRKIDELVKKDEILFYKHHVQFVDMEETLSEKIIRYIFERQREESQWR